MQQNNIIILYNIFIMQYDNIYEIKEKKKNNNLKKQNLITSTQSRVLNNTKIHQPKVEMQNFFFFFLNPPKMKKKIERKI